MKQISAPSDFLDDIVIVTRVITNRFDLILADSPRFGLFVGLFVGIDRESQELTQIENLDSYLKSRSLQYLKSESLGNHAVRDLFTRKLKLNVLDEPTVKITAWLNIVIPAGDLIDKTKIRIEAYTNQAAAIHDAGLEREDPNIQAVVMKSFTLRSP